MPLTVGDVIGQLPPELVRGGALANEQPITLPPSLIENALRSGQAAVPVFEIYRVCPALFQTPVSPQDPRLVQLPAAKLPSLIASARTQGSNAALASPFAAAQPQGGERSMASSNAPSAFPMSPFAAAIPAAGGSENVPLSGTSQQGASPFPATGVPSQPPSGPSPFGAASSQPGASPFGMAGSAAPSQAPSPFAPAATPQAASPFAVAPPQGTASPFSSAAPQGGASPFASAASPGAASPFAARVPEPEVAGAALGQPTASTPPFQAAFSQPRESPFAAAAPASAPQVPGPSFAGFAPQQSAASPFGAAAPQLAMPPSDAGVTAQPVSAPPVPAAKGDKVKLGLAAILAGYSREELGFDPVMAPAWLQTSIERAPLQEQAHTGAVMVELGTLIDGVSDMGFRNMLTGAKREYAIKLPQNEVFHALTEASSGSPTPSAEIAVAPVSPPSPVNQGMFVPPGPPPAPQGFSPPPAAPTWSPPAVAQPASPPPITFAPFPMAPTESRAMFEEKQPRAESANFAPPPSPEPSDTQAPSASGSVMEGMAGLFVSKAADVASQVRPTTINMQPKPGVFSAFATGEKPQPAPAQPVAKGFDPFGSPSASAAAPVDSGLSSAQLLGQSPAASAFGLPSSAPASRPLIDPFANAKPAMEPPAAPLIPDNPAPTAFFAPGKPEVPPHSTPAFSEPTRPAGFPPAPEIQRLPPSQPPAPMAEAKPTVDLEASPPAASRPSANGQHSFLGLSPLDTDSDQLLLRALLGSEEKLDGNRVVRLLATQPGLCACVCLHGSSVLSHAKADVADAAAFQQQAAEIARQVRGLAPLIGIANAETFTLNAGKRLITFCFPGDVILGVLHENEPTTGLRDKITLVARELARMLT